MILKSKQQREAELTPESINQLLNELEYQPINILNEIEIRREIDEECDMRRNTFR